MEQRELLIESTLDHTFQPSLFYGSESTEKRPLLVGLHTWSFDRFNQVKNMLPYAEANDFNLLLPEFRGKNTAGNPECKKACGSEFAKQDIKDAIDYVIANENVDPKHIFLLGSSGGGHMALLMAGMIPEYFEAIAAFVPITNLSNWYDQTDKYKNSILACCGGEDREEMLQRSPVSYIDVASKGTIKLFHGKWDPVVPFSQSVTYFDEMQKRYPDAKVYLDIFDGKHQMDLKQALYWFLTQYKKNQLTDVSR